MLLKEDRQRETKRAEGTLSLGVGFKIGTLNGRLLKKSKPLYRPAESSKLDINTEI